MTELSRLAMKCVLKSAAMLSLVMVALAGCSKAPLLPVTLGRLNECEDWFEKAMDINEHAVKRGIIDRRTRSHDGTA